MSKALFSSEQFEAIKSRIKLKGLARKYGCSSKYIALLIKGERPVKSNLSQAIYAELRAVLIDIEQEPVREQLAVS